GTYEIYKIASESPLQFISEDAGQYNIPKELSPGSYLVLADCSSQIVNIYPRGDVTLTAHKVNFIPIQPPKPNDKFSIQCLRSDRTRSRQHFSNHFSIAVLSGVREFLVGMVPIQMNLEAGPNQKSKLISYRLSSISVAGQNMSDLQDKFTYFLTPVSEVAPYTESQADGGKMYVLKGQYQVQVNGTSTNIDLAEGEGRVLVPATLKVEVSKNAQLEESAKIKGSPLYVEINGEHFLHLNSTYAVLPGPIKVRLSTAVKPIEIAVKEAESIRLKAKNVIVKLNCAAEDWTCLGSRKVFVFERGKPSQLAESVSDTAVLYFGDNVSVGIEGSRNLRYNLTPLDDQIIKVGYIEVTPTPIHKAGVLTDLVRIEPSNPHVVGTTLDMPLDKMSLIPVPVGSYNLAQFTYFSADGSRRKSTTPIFVGVGEKQSLSITTFLTEKRISTLDISPGTTAN
ncbi:MAG: hypothetical protein NT027_03690, partial [Proteobacteria bacterium]|nr:hypothetical protein [Pseudomonadota bacterium]